ncbi:trifunctional hydroxymethylpyrimidine kinase/phosphomethylpyrimidine kinase/thiaminase [Knufia peltigerae]|uniref:Trifunctional hydroxymethylpyrimidine kinase/phosphomethylpyrimidine kinase/thiaminase n=1 Tax=Knufia peltigerae TaxID=1002370 RepID=A0AA39CSD6_9EURO|nr:trifunctional hydroxymethylpyrimidine kinase/phosphomethylpyrimidine kinase/thiaminase [Knufia peltigerae]
MAPPKVLVIAGSDSSGGAGLEADQKVLAAHGCYAMTATTALTAQNTLGVQDVHITPPAFVGKQIDACLSDVGCHAVKLGMLGSAGTIKVIAKALDKHRVNTIVLDPVMVSTSGHQLLPGDAIRNLRELLLPMTTLLTPNIPEALLLVREADSDADDNMQYGDETPPTPLSPTCLEDLKQLAKMVHGLGPRAVLLKGGHMPLTTSYDRATTDEEMAVTVDILYDGARFTLVESPYLRSRNTHGTGCSLASAIAANLATTKWRHGGSKLFDRRDTLFGSLPAAVRSAVHYVSVGIQTSHDDVGGSGDRGCGPINHFHNVHTLPFSRGHFVDDCLLSDPRVAPVWERYTRHPFVTSLARGTLPEKLFKNYLVQDYLYLTHFARTHALAAYKSRSMDSIVASANIILHIRREMDLHLSYCEEFGIQKSELDLDHDLELDRDAVVTPSASLSTSGGRRPARRTKKESLACTAYSRYVLDVGSSQDWLAIQMALAPCLLGYAEAARLARVDPARKTTAQGNRYWRWVENYVAEDYLQAVRAGRDLIERHMTKQSPERINELIDIFVRATEMEVKFWDFDAHPDIDEDDE